MNKSVWIRSLDSGQRSTRQIAEIVGCLPEYVRAVRQRRDHGNHTDYRWRRKVYAHGDRTAARAAQSEAWRRARESGMGHRQASSISGGVYTQVMIRTGVRALKQQRPAGKSGPSRGCAK